MKVAAKLFALEMEERFLAVSDVIPTFLCSANLRDPRQKGIDSNKKLYGKAKPHCHASRYLTDNHESQPNEA